METVKACLKQGALLIAALPVFCALITHSVASPTQVRFAINAPGSPPYLFYDKLSQSYSGVVVDFFSFVEARGDYVVSYLDSNRVRSENFLLQGEADVFLSAVEWLDNPESFVLSDTFMKHASYMYSTSAFYGPFVPADNPNASICTRYGFIYPVLQEFFYKNSGGLVRVNSNSQTTMAMMLARGRCDFTIMSEQNALSIMFDEQFCDTAFYQSSNVISDVDLVFVIRPELAALRDTIKLELKNFTNSGALQESINRHSGIHRFPKHKCPA
jgi:ABC-type amino acid transport substrate-binding protein